MHSKTRLPGGLRAVLVTMLVLIAMLLAASGWLLATQHGARTAFSLLHWMTDGAVRAEGIYGLLGSSVRIGQLDIGTADRQITIRDLQLDWEPVELLQRRVHVRQLIAGDLYLAQKIKQEQEPAQLPTEIGLPVKLQLDKLHVRRGRVTHGSMELLAIDDILLHLVYDGERYRLGLDQLALRATSREQAASVQLSGHATIATTKPYPVDARFRSSAKASLRQYALAPSGHVSLDGSLEELVLGLDLRLDRAQANGHVVVQPFAQQPLKKADINASALDLSLFSGDLPHTEIWLRLIATGAGNGKLELTNAAAGSFQQSRLPLTQLKIDFQHNANQLLFEKIDAALGSAPRPAGSISGSGRYADSALTLALSTSEFNLRRLDARLPATQLNGTLDISHRDNAQLLAVALNEPLKKEPMSVSARATIQNDRAEIHHARMQIGQGNMSLSGHVELSGRQNFAAQGELNRFRLQDLGNFSELPPLLLNGRFDVRGARSPQLAGELSFQITDSMLAGHPVRGEGRAQLRQDQVNVPHLFLAAGANHLTMNGELSQQDSLLHFAIQAPKLEQLGKQFSGAITANGSARGTIDRPRLQLEWNASKVRLPHQIRIAKSQGNADLDIDRKNPLVITAATIDASASGLATDTQQLQSLSLRARFAPQPDAPLAVEVQAQKWIVNEFRANSVTATINGTTTHHKLDATMVEPKQKWELAANGALHDLGGSPFWEGTIDQFNTSGQLSATLERPAMLKLSAQQIMLERFRLHSDAAKITIDQLTRDASGISTRGNIAGAKLNQLLRFAAPSPSVVTDLELDGNWDITIKDTVNGSVALRRTGGDVTIRSTTPVRLGLSALQATIVASDGRVGMEVNARGRQLGQIDIDLATGIAADNGTLSIPGDTPLSGRARINVPTIAWVGPMISATLTTEGTLQSNITIGGTLAQPKLDGRNTGSALRFYSSDLGVDLRNGILDSEFRESQLLVKALRFQQGDGQLTIAGPLNLAHGKPDAKLTLSAERFMLLNQSDRRLNISGSSRILLMDGRTSVSGEFMVNSGYFDIGREGTPQLSGDVIIVGSSKQSGKGAMPELDIRVGLGDGIRLEGRGINAILVGQMRLQNGPGEPLQAYGSLRIAKGSYAAYGRELAIERGALRFTGPINNPALNILAMRRGQEVEAGVAVQGTVLAPRVTLVSEPSVADAEKLSWLVLGRGLSGVGEGELGSLQNAAAAILSQGAAAGLQSQLANAFGLDTFSVSRSDDNLQQRIITLGKQISSRLYLSYQQGLDTANRAVLLRYVLSPRLTIEVEAGTRSALSLFYNFTFD